MKFTFLFAPVIGSALLLSSCSNGNDGTGSAGASTTITASLQTLGLSTLAAAVDAADLEGTLAGTGPFTLFAPSNAAFAALPQGTLDSLLLPQNRQQLIDLLRYHLLSGEFNSTVASTLSSANTVNGAPITIDAVGSNLFINNARVTLADRDATNGVIHIVDRVLTQPQSLVSTLQGRGFSTLVTAVGAANLATTLSGPGPFTVLAPTNAAFAALGQATLDSLLLPANQVQLANILTYHVVPGRVTASDP